MQKLEVDIAIPADHTDIIENPQTGNTAHKAKGAINRLEEQLRGSVFDHDRSPFQRNPFDRIFRDAVHIFVL